MVYRILALCLTILAAALAADPDPWTKSELLEPERVAARLKDAGAIRPMLIEVSFPMLYRNRHLPDAVYAGPGNKSEGLEMLKTAVAGQPKDRQIVLYCGCCPMDRCPNVRPAFRMLRELGFQNVKVMSIPNNLAKDWIEKGYPIVKAAAQ